MTSLGNHSNPFLLKMTSNYNIIKYQIIFFSLDFLDLMMKRNILATMKSQKKLKKKRLLHPFYCLILQGPLEEPCGGS